MPGPDSYYTPTALAQQLVDYVTAERVRKAIDFCVGDGDLLKAVVRRYADAELYGTDISDETIGKLKCEHDDWTTEVCDFRDDESVGNVQFLHDNSFDLIVLNPPFTCKGSVVEHIEFEGQTFKVSTAMFFLMRALRFLSDDGGLYAILPISCVRSEKDQAAWNYLCEHHNACVLDYPSRIYFSSKCSPRIALVYVGNYKVEGHQPVACADFTKLPVTDVVRGSVRMQGLQYVDTKGSLRLIHTTNIQNGKLVNIQRIARQPQLIVNGNGVVIPRVCNPNPNKIALLNANYTYHLSDCVIVIRTNTRVEAQQVKDFILANWSDFRTLYTGTGAQYTTLARVKKLFGKGC